LSSHRLDACAQQWGACGAAINYKISNYKLYSSGSYTTVFTMKNLTKMTVQFYRQNVWNTEVLRYIAIGINIDLIYNPYNNI